MNRFRKNLHQAVFAFLASAVYLVAQPAPSPSGHWVGTLGPAEAALPIVVDLRKDARQEWMGAFTASVGGFGARDAPLASISVTVKTVRFVRPGVPGTPVFEGRISQDGSLIAGNETSSGRP